MKTIKGGPADRRGILFSLNMDTVNIRHEKTEGLEKSISNPGVSIKGKLF